jgi:CheY-like chemotaxis protein
MSLSDPQIITNFRTIPQTTKPARRDPVRVLVANDDPATRRLLIPIGEKDGYQFVNVEDGREAYRMLKSDGDFGAAVFDMAMPHLKGVEIVRYMKTENRLKRIPIVVIAGEHGLKLIAECFAAGAMTFLPKPFSTEQLRRTLRMAINSQAAKRPVVSPSGGSQDWTANKGGTPNVEVSHERLERFRPARRGAG